MPRARLLACLTLCLLLATLPALSAAAPKDKDKDASPTPTPPPASNSDSPPNDPGKNSQPDASPGKSGEAPGGKKSQPDASPGKSGEAPGLSRDSAPGSTDSSSEPKSGPSDDSRPDHSIRIVSPPTQTSSPATGDGGAASHQPENVVRVLQRTDEHTEQIQVHVSPEGDAKRVYLRQGKKELKLNHDHGSVYTLPLLPALTESPTPFTITADFGSTTASVKGVLAATTPLRVNLRPALNQLFRLAYGRNPTFAEWSYWALRLQAGDKGSVPELFGAMQWHKLFDAA